MASMDDLISTLSGGMHVGQQGNDLKDLHAKLAQTLHPTIPTYRPIPPTNTTPHTSSGPMPPPAPVSSWNDHQSQTQLPLTSSWNNMGMGNSPRQGGYTTNGNSGGHGVVVSGSGKRELGFSIPAPKSGNGQGQGQGGEERLYHANVLPVRASPKDTGGFGDDAFAPLWNGQGKSNGFK